jgi:uncharacterized membrane protein
MSNAKELAEFARDITYDTTSTELSGITVQGAGGATGAGGALGYYAAFGSTANITIATSGETAYFEGLFIDPVVGSNQITVGGPNNDLVTINSPGIYNIEFSAQFTGNNNNNIFVWLEQNGVTVPNSNTKLQTVGGTAFQLAAWNWFIKKRFLRFFKISE